MSRFNNFKLFIYDEDAINFEMELVRILKSNPMLIPNLHKLNLDEERHLTMKMLHFLKEIGVWPMKNLQYDNKYYLLYKILLCWHFSTGSKIYLNYLVFHLIESLGSERHHLYLHRLYSAEMYGCLSLTEVAHGSDTKRIITTAIYDNKTEQFIINTPSFEGAKCWSGNLGKTAHFTVLYAQLYCKNKCYGVHCFIVDVRNPDSLIPYPGVIIGDLGPKGGINGVDNGFVIFKNYPIPRKNLLNKVADVTHDGKYISANLNQSNMILKIMIIGRIHVMHVTESLLAKALTITIRYASIPQNSIQLIGNCSILDNQLYKIKLLTSLSANYMFLLITKYLFNLYYKIQSCEEQNMNINELHVISSAGKSVTGWISRNIIRDLLDICSNLGFPILPELINIRNNQEISCTIEGDSFVLIQQTSNWLIKKWRDFLKTGKTTQTILNSIDYLSNVKQILEMKFESADLNGVLKAYKWLVCYLVKKSNEKLTSLKNHQSFFFAKNNTQVYYLTDLSEVYFQHYLIDTIVKTIQNINDFHTQEVILKLINLYSVWMLEKKINILYEGGFATNSEVVDIINQKIVELSNDLTVESFNLVEGIAPDNFLIAFSLGKSLEL